MTDDPPIAINLRRLLAWHDLSQQDLALLVGASEHTVSGWVTGKREPGGRYLRELSDLFGIGTLWGDPDKVGHEIADPTRFREAEERIRRARLKVVK